MNATTRVAVCDDALAVKLFLRQVLEEEGDMEVVETQMCPLGHEWEGSHSGRFRPAYKDIFIR